MPKKLRLFYDPLHERVPAYLLRWEGGGGVWAEPYSAWKSNELAVLHLS